MATVVENFATNYAEALMSFSPENISSYYREPLAIYSDNGVQLVDTPQQTLGFWQQGVKPYQQSGISNAAPTVLQEEQLSDKLYTAKILWTNTNSNDEEVSREVNFYILSQHEEEMKICGLIIMKQE